ncbi:MAG: methyltransferase domain-containing protein [Candidatus Paceibacterota bacterium]
MGFSDPTVTISQLSLAPGAQVADLGSGSGFYALALAREVGDSGRVFAVDVQKDLLTRLKTQANKEHLYNIEVIWGDLERRGGTKLKDASVDDVVISNVLFQISEKDAFADEARRIVKRGGRLLIVDWSDSFGGMGPQPEHIFTEGEARELFERHGFVLERSIEAGEHHYGIIMRTK